MNLDRKGATPRNIGRASPPIVLPQPNGSSVCLRFCWGWRVVRASIVEVRLDVFRAI
jgi:hypothetical protein